MNSVFNEQLLLDKFSKLVNTQQCINTLSHLCIFHRKEAELVVGTWNKQFHKSDMVQKVPLLYLANDIIQNSKRNGNEFVTEFWKVLPAAVKDVAQKGDDKGKNAVSRLVDIWEQRRVFGSRAKGLKELLLAEELPPPLEFGKKRSRSVRIVKRDAHSIRTKLSIGGTTEKIVSAFHLVLNENSIEDTEMSKCKSAALRVRKMEQDVDEACSKVKDPKRKTLAKEVEQEEMILKQCIEKLKSIEANRLALVSQLREALHVQESELENVRTQMQAAQEQVEEACSMKKRLISEEVTQKSSNNNNNSSKSTAASIAAEVADKLAASSSSQYIMRSVLSTFAAEEEAKKQNPTASSVPPQNNVNVYHQQQYQQQPQQQQQQQYIQYTMVPYGYNNNSNGNQTLPTPPIPVMPSWPQQLQQQQPPPPTSAPPNYGPFQQPSPGMMVYYNHPPPPS